MQSEYFLQINYPYFLNYMLKIYKILLFILSIFSCFVYYPSCIFSILVLAIVKNV